MYMLFRITFILCFVISAAHAQKIDRLIKEKNIRRIETTLAADDMAGRKPGTAGVEKAATFIAAEFKKAKLEKWDGNETYLQHFSMYSFVTETAAVELNGSKLDEKDFHIISAQESLNWDNNTAVEKLNIKAGDNPSGVLSNVFGAAGNVLIVMDTSHRNVFNRVKRYRPERMSKEGALVFVLTADAATEFKISAKNKVTEKKFFNVVGIIPGKSRPDEYVIFSAHYDHLGIGKPNAEQDSIFNGANDDASGTTAVIALARYFNKIKQNERTLVFAAFTAEESGGFGSQYFSKQFDPGKVMAMFNIEMIGTDSKWGKNSAYITGYEKTDMGKIMQQNLEGTGFLFQPDPYPDQQLFYRSDNATLARLGVPAHTISTSKMDSEKYYHTQDDEAETLDLKNMTEIIKAIALSSRSIVAGKDTPGRVNTGELR
jgi:Zn-dependent M28 family amino/carboxypeptidase